MLAELPERAFFKPESAPSCSVTNNGGYASSAQTQESSGPLELPFDLLVSDPPVFGLPTVFAEKRIIIL